ncbi:hypothetical protein [Pseudomonas sp. NCCP-436]|uniref:hypothetical protein n=1 Tax=Pseudomonas sp. NCCP-436 TaxID=2842481 RepID=UPI001C7F37F2|nr:hypothetical protein [Pseudomonas sp. NCCP-436]GIZ10946.1 hypothetical protein NCCP436_03620 [Pseudomonas sp. NCCP-436]
MHCRIAVLLCLLLLSACSSVTRMPQPLQPPQQALAADPLSCQTRAECTTKVARTLLFVFDYAAAGAPLVQRDGRLLFTPEDAAPDDWPALHIRLAEPLGGRFVLDSHCRVASCRVAPAAVQQAYRYYLQGGACGWQAGHCVPQAR